MDITQANIEHAVLTQAHRWFQLYERDERYMENQLDILTDQISLKSISGEVHGHTAYQERVAQLPVWNNSHRIQAAKVKRVDKNILTLDMEILYQNVGSLPGGALSSTLLHYSTTLQEGLALLPKFSEIIISNNTTELSKKYPSFQDQYPENRVKSLVHYWLYLIESRPNNVAHFNELLTDTLDLSFSSGHIQNNEAFELWLKEGNARVLRSGHTIERFDLVLNSAHEYEVEMEFEWRGFMQAQPQIEFEGRTLHNWIIVDNPSERFARIKSMKVHMLKNFQPCAREEITVV